MTSAETRNILIRQDALACAAAAPILLIGDSHVERWLTLETLAGRPVFRAGIAGATAFILRSWLPWDAIAALRPALTIILGPGTNEVVQGLPCDEAWMQAMREIITRAGQLGAGKVLMATDPPPAGLGDGVQVGANGTINAFNGALWLLARRREAWGAGTGDLPVPLGWCNPHGDLCAPGSNDWSPAEDTLDGVHRSAGGYLKLASVLEAAALQALAA